MSEHGSDLTSHFSLNGRPSTTFQCSKLLYFRISLDGPKVGCVGQMYITNKKLQQGEICISSIGHSAASSEGTETDIYQVWTTQLTLRTTDVLTPSQ